MVRWFLSKLSPVFFVLEDGLFDLPVMDAPVRDEFLITEPNALIQSREIGSAPSQIDKLFTVILEYLLISFRADFELLCHHQ